MAPFDRSHNVPIVFHSNYGPVFIISEIKRDMDLKLRFLYPGYSTPPLWVSLSEYCRKVWYAKT